VFGFVNGFIDCLYTPLRTTPNYSAIADLLGFTVFTSRILATDFNTVIIPVTLNHTLQISLYYSTHNVFSSQPNSFHAIFSQSSSTTVSRDSLNSNSAGLGSSLFSIGAAPTENTVS
jgi:hypothetical protein